MCSAGYNGTEGSGVVHVLPTRAESQSRQWPPARTCSHQLICAACRAAFFSCGANPADWMMEVTSADAEAAAGTSFAEAYAASELRRWAFLVQLKIFQLQALSPWHAVVCRRWL